MHEPVQLTINRISSFLNELNGIFWLDKIPLQVSVYQCNSAIPFADALAQHFTPVDVDFRWGPTWSTAWFHFQGEFPDKWAGCAVAALIDTGSEGLVWTSEGPQQGLDANRHDYLLAAPAMKDGVVDIYVEAAANPGPRQEYNTAPTPFTFNGASVARFNPGAWELHFDLAVLLDIVTHLPEESARRVQLVRAMNDAINAYRRGGDEAFSRARACLVVEYAKPAMASMSQVNAVPQSHIDTAWLWPIRETKRKCARTFSTALRNMESYPEYFYMQSQPQLYAYVKESYPALYARIKQAVKEGRWEAEGAMWVEPDCNIPSGESLIRQFLYGKRFFREEFGVESTVLWLPDVFGYNAALPQIMQGCGVPYFATTKMSWNKFNTFPYHSFLWEGIDGTRVLAHQTPMFGGGLEEQAGWLLKGEQRAQDKDRASTWLYPFGPGDGGGGPTKGMLEVMRRLQNVEGMPPTKLGKMHEWFPRLAAEAEDLPVWVGELYLEVHRGTYTTQAKVKAANRRSELMLHDAEFFAALFPAATDNYPHELLDDAWKLLLLNQFHDILPGSSIHTVYEDAAVDYQVIYDSTEGIINDSLNSLINTIDTADMKSPILVCNTLGFKRNEFICLPLLVDHIECRSQDVAEGSLIEVGDIPPLGYQVIDLQAASEGNGDTVIAGNNTLENGLILAEFNERGELISLFDKSCGRETISAGATANRFQRIDECGIRDSAWEISSPYQVDAEELTAPAAITVVEEGPLRATLRVKRQLTPKAHLVQYIRLTAGSKRLDFQTQLDWQEDSAMLKVAFPLAIHSPQATFEIQFGHLEHPTHRNTSWDAARYEVPAQKWADLSEADYGVALLNDSKYGYDVLGNVLRLSLLRATSFPDPHADRGQHTFTYSLLPHSGAVSSEVVQQGLALNVPLYAMELSPKKGSLPASASFCSVDKDNIIIDTIKRAEDGDGFIMRIYESARSRGNACLHFGMPMSCARRTDMLENNLHEISVENNTIKIDYRPFEIITLRVNGKNDSNMI